MQHHQGQRKLFTDFKYVWKLVQGSGQSLMTPNGHSFVARAGLATKGTHQGEKVIRIENNGKEFARIYPCCWRHTTNCYGTYIDGYSDALELWLDGEAGEIWVGNWD